MSERFARTYCEVCGREIPGDHHPSVLLITHHTWKHERKEAA